MSFHITISSSFYSCFCRKQTKRKMNPVTARTQSRASPPPSPPAPSAPSLSPWSPYPKPPWNPSYLPSSQTLTRVAATVWEDTPATTNPSCTWKKNPTTRAPVPTSPMRLSAQERRLATTWLRTTRWRSYQRCTRYRLVLYWNLSFERGLLDPIFGPSHITSDIFMNTQL